jgi:serine O-acetyltransferase
MWRAWAKMRSDVQAVLDHDPAARHALEVVVTYAGVHAIWFHRLAHMLYRRRWYGVARCISMVSRWCTGIEIHPGAVIGERVFIDHGMGVVIGETCEIGNDVVLYQGVTLGGTGKERGKRHPTIEDHVVVGSGAKVLGSFTVGAHARIGANAVVLEHVPPHSTVVGNPGRLVRLHGVRVGKLDHANVPDPYADVHRLMREDIDALKQRIVALEDIIAQNMKGDAS